MINGAKSFGEVNINRVHVFPFIGGFSNKVDAQYISYG